MMSHKSSLMVGCLSFFVVLVLLGPATTAGDEIELDRELSVSEEPDSFHAVSTSVGFNMNDRFDLIFDEGTLTLWYAENSIASSPPSWEFEISFERVFAFVDNGNGRFDSGDTIASVVDLTDTHYSLTYSSASLPDGGNKTTVTAVSEDGVLTLVFTVVTSPSLVGQVPVSPSEAKMDIVISGERFGGEANHIGLSMSVDVDTESAVQYEDQANSGELNLSHNDLGGFLRWGKNATVDGVVRPVGASWDGETLTLSYPAGELVVHDPLLGVRSVAPLSGQFALPKAVGNLLLYGFGLALATAALVGAVAIRRKKNY